MTAKSESRKRTALIAVRLYPAEKAEIEQTAAACGVSVGELVRVAALDRCRGTTTPVRTAGEGS